MVASVNVVVNLVLLNGSDGGGFVSRKDNNVARSSGMGIVGVVLCASDDCWNVGRNADCIFGDVQDAKRATRHFVLWEENGRSHFKEEWTELASLLHRSSIDGGRLLLHPSTSNYSGCRGRNGKQHLWSIGWSSSLSQYRTSRRTLDDDFGKQHVEVGSINVPSGFCQPSIHLHLALVWIDLGSNGYLQWSLGVGSNTETSDKA